MHILAIDLGGSCFCGYCPYTIENTVYDAGVHNKEIFIKITSFGFYLKKD